MARHTLTLHVHVVETHEDGTETTHCSHIESRELSGDAAKDVPVIEESCHWAYRGFNFARNGPFGLDEKGREMDESFTLPQSLWYGSVLVGMVRDPYYSDQTWFATLDRAPAVADNKIAHRVAEFIDFCKAWHQKTEQDVSEFDRFSDLLASGLWVTKDVFGAVLHQIAEAPVFVEDDEISWRVCGR
jgi:hypothetical protein